MRNVRASSTSLPAHVQEMACFIHELEGDGWSTTKAYLQRYLRKRERCTEENLKEMLEVVAQFYGERTAEERKRWRSPCTPEDSRKRAAAQKFLTEVTVNAWLEETNVRLGKAPASTYVIRTYRKIADSFAHAVPPGVLISSNGSLVPQTRSFLKIGRAHV